MATDYGTGIASIPSGFGLDLDPYFRRITGPAVVAHAVARRLFTRRGSLWWAPDEGYDVRALLLESVRDGDIPTLERLIAIEVERDERVLSADVSMTFADDALRLDVTLHLADGAFPMVLAVSKVTSSMLLGTAN